MLFLKFYSQNETPAFKWKHWTDRQSITEEAPLTQNPPFVREFGL